MPKLMIKEEGVSVLQLKIGLNTLHSSIPHGESLQNYELKKDGKKVVENHC